MSKERFSPLRTSMNNPPSVPPWPSEAGFLTTHWSLLRQAESDPASVSQAMEELFRVYWPPLYAFLRRSGCSAADAQDLVQGFFERWIERGSLGTALPERGRFRSYLLGALKHYWFNERQRAAAAKRGGGQVVLPLNFDGVEEAYQRAPSDELGPEKLFDREWAEQLLQQARAALRAEMERAGKGALCEQLEFCVGGPPARGSYQQLAEAAGLSEGAFKVAIHRFRERFRQQLRSAVARTVENESEIDGELRYLIEIISA
jgi:RNA polymerase sigma factor (sigma-70 family)